MDRLFAMLLTAATASCLLSGCGGSDTATPQTPSPTDLATPQATPTPTDSGSAASESGSEGLTLPDDVPISAEPPANKNDQSKGMQLPDDLAP